MLAISDIGLTSSKLSVALCLTFVNDIICKSGETYSHLGFINDAFTFTTNWICDDLENKFDREIIKNKRDALLTYPIDKDNSYVRLVRDALFYALGPMVYTSTLLSQWNSSNIYYVELCAQFAGVAFGKREGLGANLTINVAKQYTHNILLEILPFILDYKIKNQESFGNSEIIFNYLNEEDKERFIYHMDIFKYSNKVVVQEL